VGLGVAGGVGVAGHALRRATSLACGAYALSCLVLHD
jgi:hypothetical protein